MWGGGAGILAKDSLFGELLAAQPGFHLKMRPGEGSSIGSVVKLVMDDTFLCLNDILFVSSTRAEKDKRDVRLSFGNSGNGEAGPNTFRARD